MEILLGIIAVFLFLMLFADYQDMRWRRSHEKKVEQVLSEIRDLLRAKS